MTWKHIFFGFDGRLSRRQWWLAIVPLLLASVVMSFLANPMAWFSETIARRGPTLAETLFDIALLIPETAVMVKRFNDRDWPQWLPYGYAAAYLTFTVLDHNGVILASTTPDMFELAFIATILAITLAIIIDNGFLRGTRGPNRHGPDPLADTTGSTVGPGPASGAPMQRDRSA